MQGRVESACTDERVSCIKLAFVGVIETVVDGVVDEMQWDARVSVGARVLRSAVAASPSRAGGHANGVVNATCAMTHYQHTHPLRFNGPFSGTTRVGRYQKDKTNLEFTEATDSEWQWHQLGHMQVCTSLQTDNHVSTPPLSFLQAGCPSCRPTNSVKALKATIQRPTTNVLTLVAVRVI